MKKAWVQDKAITIAFYRKPQRILRRRSQSVGGSCKHVASQKPRKEAMTNRTKSAVRSSKTRDDK